MKKAFSKRFGKRVSYAPDSFPGLVDKATDEMLFKLDWGLVTEVCDKASHVMGKEELRLGVRAARKRIQDDQHKVVMFGLQVIDALVKNNSQNFYFLQFMAEQKMMNSLVRLVDRGIDKGGRDNLEAMEKVLDMLQAWGEGYHNHQDKGLRLFVETYHKLRERNVKFPRPLPNLTAPLFTPKSSVQANNPPPPQVNMVYQQAPVLQAPGQQNMNANNGVYVDRDLEIALQLSQQQAQGQQQAPVQQQAIPLSKWLETVANTIALLEQSLNAAESKEEVKGNEIIKDLVEHLDASQKELMTRLQSNVNEADMHTLLHMNDSIHHVKDLHAIVLAEGPRKNSNPGSSTDTNNAKAQEDDSLINLAEVAIETVPPSPNMKKMSSKKENGKKKQEPEIQRQSTEEDLMDLFSAPQQETNNMNNNNSNGLVGDLSNLDGLMPMSTLPPSSTNGNDNNVMQVMNATKDNGLNSSNGHNNPISNAIGLMPQMPVQQKSMYGGGQVQQQGFNNNNNKMSSGGISMMPGFGRGQNYLATGNNNNSNPMMFQAQNNTFMNTTSMNNTFQTTQQMKQQTHPRSRGNSNPFQTQMKPAPQEPSQRNRGNSNPFLSAQSNNNKNSNNSNTTNKTINNPKSSISSSPATTGQQNDEEKFMYFNNGRRVSINKGSNNNSGNNNNNSQQNNNNDKKDTSSPFGGLKQPKAGKRRVRGNSGGNAKDIDIFADLNDLALNPED